MVIDDPVQSMDPAKVDGLARVLAEAAERARYRLHPRRAAARGGRPARHRRAGHEVKRRARSKVEVVRGARPSERYLGEALALCEDRRTSPTRSRPASCPASAAARSRRRARRGSGGGGSAEGDPHAEVEATLAGADRDKERGLAEAFGIPVNRGAGDHQRGPPSRAGAEAVSVVAQSKAGAHAPLPRRRRARAHPRYPATREEPRGRMTPVLDHARRLLDESTRGTVSSWPRAVALLTRQDLEDALDAYWQAREPELRWANMRTQLGCLRIYADERLAGETSWLWHTLSRATHHHPYELDPRATSWPHSLRAQSGSPRICAVDV